MIRTAVFTYVYAVYEIFISGYCMSELCFAFYANASIDRDMEVALVYITIYLIAHLILCVCACHD